jgi:hypothetical protein
MAENQCACTGFYRYLINYTGLCVQFPCDPAFIFRHGAVHDKRFGDASGFDNPVRTRCLLLAPFDGRASCKGAAGANFHVSNDGLQMKIKF